MKKLFSEERTESLKSPEDKLKIFTLVFRFLFLLFSVVFLYIGFVAAQSRQVNYGLEFILIPLVFIIWCLLIVYPLTVTLGFGSAVFSLKHEYLQQAKWTSLIFLAVGEFLFLFGAVYQGGVVVTVIVQVFMLIPLAIVTFCKKNKKFK